MLILCHLCINAYSMVSLTTWDGHWTSEKIGKSITQTLPFRSEHFMEYANINYDGYVYKCTAQDYKVENALGYLNEKGDIVWHENYLKRNREKAKADFENPVCLKCNYLPLCGGPCFAKRQYMEEFGADSCPIKNTDTDIDTFIRESYHAICQKRSQHV